MDASRYLRHFVLILVSTTLTKNKTILGIDPGTNILGFGVIGINSKGPFYVDMGVFDLRKIKDPYEKLANIFAGVSELIEEHKPDIFVCGHSHILKVVRDTKRNMLVINPGAAGIQGFHVVRTALRFHIENGKMHSMEVFELDR